MNTEMLIGSRFEAGTETPEQVLNPRTGKLIEAVPEASTAQIDAAVAMVALALVSSPRSAAEYEGEVTFAMVRDIVDRRCIECHSATPTSELYDVAPQGVMFDTPQQIADRASRINTQVVVTQQMPLSNLTGMTDEERAIFGAWYRRGAPTE